MNLTIVFVCLYVRNVLYVYNCIHEKAIKASFVSCILLLSLLAIAWAKSAEHINGAGYRISKM